MTKEEIKNKVAKINNFDSFRRAVHYTFGRNLLPTEEEFLNKIIDESMEEYAQSKLPTEEEVEKEVKKMSFALCQKQIGDKKLEDVLKAHFLSGAKWLKSKLK